MPKSLVLLQFCKQIGVTNEEEDVLLVVKPYLFTISTIILPEPEILVAMATDAKIDTNAKTNNDAKISIDAKIGIDTKIDIDMKNGIDELIFKHTVGEILVNTTPSWIKVHDMRMAKWNLSNEIKIHPLNLSIHDELQVVKLNVNLDLSIANASQ
jgi:hypothetical protein